MAASRISGIALKDQRILIVGGGAAGIGIARQLRESLAMEGLDGQALETSVAVTDSGGLIHQGREIDDSYKKEFAWSIDLLEAKGLSATDKNDLLACIKAIKPTVLIGTSGQSCIFNEEVVKAMASFVQRPAISLSPTPPVCPKETRRTSSAGPKAKL
ncbi:MAG: hypothetical protein IPJ88_10845 [Myxococcales bacterium]|nr:MAG: hypothetical protein IPJ88_10845 [Myxococcales bacterium]